MRKLIQNIGRGYRGFVSGFQGKSSDYGDPSSIDNILNQFYTMYGLGAQKGIGWLTALGAIQYYKLVAPIANGIDLISQQCSDIPLSIWDKKNKVWIKDGDTQGTPQKMFDLLKRTDYTETYSTFIRSQVAYKIITGNCFTILVSGGISGPPVS